jgi:3-(methylthio)propanoyl-CoA dehydrogenase
MTNTVEASANAKQPGSRNMDAPVGMTDYKAPTADILLALKVAGLDEVLSLPSYAQADRETVEFVLTEFGRFASDVVAPTDRGGDVEGSVLDPLTGAVRTPKGFQQVYEQYVESGWGAVQFDLEHGGGGLPALVGIALQEMMASANLALSLNPVLTQSAIELLLRWGSPEQKSTYLPRLVTGEWCGTMNLTESEAGSDLGAVRTQAVRDHEGHWRISGTKIFITWGEHDLAENIVHLVLARTPGAPAGTKGLSLFLVPKCMVDTEGRLGQRNTLRCLRLEEKLGIHASPTCVMEFDAAYGELVGEEHGGIRAMFTMMNAARLSIGLQGPSVAERSFQHAYRYAKERQQGRAAGVTAPQLSVLTDHPDVRRMLLSMRTSALAGRLLIYTATGYRDRARHEKDPDARATAEAYLDLLTPVAKAWSSDIGFTAASTGVQVLGGSGYIEESGMAQRLRDSRIAPIYEGTNGIQAIDLVIRKLPRENGRWIHMLLDDVANTASGRRCTSDLHESYASLAGAQALVLACTEQLLVFVDRAPDDALAGATSYLELMGLTLGGWLMIRRAEHAQLLDQGIAKRIAAESEFFATEHMARASGLARAILAGSDRLAALD